jgi:hypothetical protein
VSPLLSDTLVRRQSHVQQDKRYSILRTQTTNEEQVDTNTDATMDYHVPHLTLDFDYSATTSRLGCSIRLTLAIDGPNPSGGSES